MLNWTDMATVLAPAKVGKAEIRHFTVNEAAAAFSRIREAATRGREQAVKVGTYAQLFVGGGLVMSDTQMERDSNRDLVFRAQGDVLIAGLGLGMVLLPLLAKPAVKSVLVVEKSADVIRLIENPIRNAAGATKTRLIVERGDIFHWHPPRNRFDTIYFDIWPNICEDNLKEIKALHERFRRKLRPRGWMTSWMYNELRGRWW